MEKTALIAMSGGVDSSVAALLMIRNGYKCTGATMRLYCNPNEDPNAEGTCGSSKDVEDARRIAESLNMPFHILDFGETFNEKVIEKFIRTYEAGRTPNPCIDCNRNLKFGTLLDFADQLHLDVIVTGHYARVVEENGRWLLKKGLDPSKDQSYVLYTLTQHQLSRIRFPLGEYGKDFTRSLAEESGFVNAHKRDSQDICFVPDGDYVGFMERYTSKKYVSGKYLDLSGKEVGTHKGAVHYTLGQRKGLGLAMGEPVYVCSKNMEDNTVTVGPESELFRSHLVADDLNWIAFDTISEPIRVTACTRYHQREQSATAFIREDGLLQLDFDLPQRAITPGQAVVLYSGDICLGGGTIKESFN